MNARNLGMLLMVGLLARPPQLVADIIVDTGPGAGRDGPILAGRSTPLGAGFWQYLAGRVSLPKATVVGTAHGWMYMQGLDTNPYTGPAKVAIHANLGGAVGAELYSAAFVLGCAVGGCAQAEWKGPSGLRWDLGPGDYWVVFSVPDGSIATAVMPGYAPNPLGSYKWYSVSNGSWNVLANVPQYHLGFRLLSPEADLKLADLTLRRAEIAGCKSVAGTVTLSMPAPAGGIAVTITDTLASASAPVTVTVPAGASSKNFSIQTTSVAIHEAGTVSATLGGTTLSRNLTVRPIGLSSVSLLPSTVVGGNDVQGIAKLECQAGPGDILVELGSTNPAVANPTVPSVVAPAGVQTVPFSVTTTPVATTTKPKITGSANGVTRTKTLTVTP